MRTRRQAAAVSTPATPTAAPRDEQAVMNGNGSPHGLKDSYPKENIFLFWPNVIGQSCFHARLVRSNGVQATCGSCSRLHPYTTCHSIRGPAPVSTASPACSMPWTDTPRDALSSRRGLGRFWIW